jgi:hypothetical protein
VNKASAFAMKAVLIVTMIIHDPGMAPLQVAEVDEACAFPMDPVLVITVLIINPGTETLSLFQGR